MLATASDADQRGAALNWLGIALQTLGERESGTARLEEAVAACRAALGKSTGLSPIAGIKGRALGGEVAAPATTAKLRRA